MTEPELEEGIREIIAEATSEHNDGWTRKYYQDKLIEAKELVDKALEEERE